MPRFKRGCTRLDTHTLLRLPPGSRSFNCPNLTLTQTPNLVQWHLTGRYVGVAKFLPRLVISWAINDTLKLCLSVCVDSCLPRLFTERSFVTIVTMVTYQSHLTGIFFFFLEPPSRLSRDCNVQQVRLQLRHTGRIVLPV